MMKKTLTIIKHFIFGVRREPVDTISTGFKTISPDAVLTYHEWAKEFNVSMLYDRQIVHL